MQEKLPPTDEEAEGATLGSLLIDSESYMAIDGFIGAEDFFSEQNQFVYTACRNVYTRGEAINQITVAQELMCLNKLDDTGGVAYLSYLVAIVPTSLHIKHYANIVRKCSVNRRIISFAGQVENIGYKNDVPEISLEKIQHLLNTQQMQVADNALISPHQLFELGADLYTQRRDGKIKACMTGITELDMELGGMFPSEVTILASRPGHGKSVLAMQIARNVGKHATEPVLFGSLEMHWRELLDRWVGSDLKVHPRSLRAGHYYDDFYQNIMDVLPVSTDNNIYLFGKGISDKDLEITTDSLYNAAYRLKANEGLSLLVIDHIGCFGDRFGNTDYSRMSHIAHRVKSVARALDVPTLAICQLSRSVESQKIHIPSNKDLRDCVVVDTTVMSASGKLVAIQDLHDAVMSFDEYDGCFKSADAEVYYAGNKDIYKVSTELGFNISCSMGHRFKTVFGYKMLGELKVGDYIGIPSVIPTISKYHDINPEIARLIGYLLGDGGLTFNTSVTWTEKDEVVIKDVESIISNNFPLVKISKKYYRGAYQLAFVDYKVGGKGNGLKNLLKALGINGQYSHQRQIPDRLLLSDKEILKEILKGLFTADGCYKDSTKYSKSIAFDTNSGILCEQVRVILLKFGIVATKNSNNGNTRSSNLVKQNHIMNRLTIEAPDDIIKFRDSIGLVGIKSDKLGRYVISKSRGRSQMLPPEVSEYIYKQSRLKHISWSKLGYVVQKRLVNGKNATADNYKGIEKSRVLQVAKVLDDENIKQIASSNLSWVRINSVEHIGIKPTYDLTVDKYHNYIANGVVVHNSGRIEEEVDNILFLYRPDKYPDVILENPELRGTAKLFWTKARQIGTDGSIDLRWNEEVRCYE